MPHTTTSKKAAAEPLKSKKTTKATKKAPKKERAPTPTDESQATVDENQPKRVLVK